MQHGLKETPRYGPLWFGAFRASEQLDVTSWVNHVIATPRSVKGVDGERQERGGEPRSLLQQVDYEVRSITRDLVKDGGCYTALLGAATAVSAADDPLLASSGLGQCLRSVFHPHGSPASFSHTITYPVADRAPSGDLTRALRRTRTAFTEGLQSISKELVWKVHFEASQMEERAATHALSLCVL